MFVYIKKQNTLFVNNNKNANYDPSGPVWVWRSLLVPKVDETSVYSSGSERNFLNSTVSREKLVD